MKLTKAFNIFLYFIFLEIAAVAPISGLLHAADDGGYSASLLSPKVHPVSSSGAVQVSIPIAVPPGRNNLTPQLQLLYNSNKSNGWLGVGWDLNLGTIQRSTTWGVDYSANEYVMIKGSTTELVSRSDWGTNYYGAVVEGEFSKYYFNTTTSGWEVSAKDGTTYYYGSDTASRQNGSGGIFKWCLDKIQDTNGNYIQITYTPNSGTLFPLDITYTLHDTLTPTTTSKISFGLENRSDQPTSYISGSEQKITERLKTISIYGAYPALSRKYQLNYAYSPSTGRSVLKDVTLYGSDGVSTLPAMSFDQQTGPTTVSEGWSQTRSDFATENEGFQTADVNGDGKADFVYDHNGTIKVKLSTDNNSFQEVTWGSLTGGYAEEMQNFQLGDVNGDGMADCVYDSSAGNIRVFLGRANMASDISTPSLSWSSVRPSYWYITTCMSGTCSTHYYPSFKLGDINGDGKADFVYLNQSGAAKVLLSDGSQFSSSPYNWGTLLDVPRTTNRAFYFYYDGKKHLRDLFQVVDINGDGKADFIYEAKNSTEVHVILGTSDTNTTQLCLVWGDRGSYDHYTESAWDSCYWDHLGWTSWFPSIYGDMVTDVGFKLGDVNGDGIADYVYQGVDQGVDGLYVMLGTPSAGFMSPEPWSYQTAAELDYRYYKFFTSYDFFLLTSTYPAPCGDVYTFQPLKYLLPFQLADINGDGLSDLVYDQHGNNSMKVLVSTGTSFDDPTLLGTRAADFNEKARTFAFADMNGNGMVDLVYDGTDAVRVMQPSGGTGVDYPDLLSGFTNGLGGSYSFTYQPSSTYDNSVMVNGQAKYLPFVVNTVSSITADYGYNDIYGGTSFVADATAPSVTDYTYEGGYFDAARREFRGFELTTKTLPDLSIEDSLYHQDDFCKGRQKEVKHFKPDGATLLEQTSLTWNNCGTILNNNDWSFVKLGSKTHIFDGVASTENYNYWDENGMLRWVISSGQGAEDITKNYDYVNKGTWMWRLRQESVTGAISGEVRRTTYNYFNDGTGNLEYKELWWAEKPAGETDPIIYYTYDPYGNIEVVRDAKGNETTTLYDAMTHSFAAKIIYPPTSGANHVTENTEFDYRFGKVKTAKDVNGNLTSYTYDLFGRLVQTDFPDGGQTKHQYFDNVTLPYTLSKSLEKTGQYIDNYQYIDGLGRPIQNVSFGEAGKSIVTKIYYDVMGRQDLVHGPFFGSGAGFPNTQPASYFWTITDYDYLDRVTQIITPHPTQGNVSASYSYSGLETTITDQDSRQKKEIRDYLDRLTEVVEYVETGEQHTTYQYNAAGEMTEVKNAYDFYTFIDYDTLGRKISMDDPDMGFWTYKYDKNNNLIEQHDSRDVVTIFDYDELNRLVQKTYTEPAPLPSNYSPTNTVTYLHDDIDANPNTQLVPNGIGQLIKVGNGDVSTTYEDFDRVGRLKKEVKGIAGDLTPSYTTSYVYDLAGKPIATTFPDTYQIEYTYYPGSGLINRVEGSDLQVYATLSSYEPNGKIGRIDHGNQVYTIYDYDNWSNRLVVIQSKDPANQDIQYKSYTYTGVGDIESITDHFRGTTYNYHYDFLHRLIAETGSGTSQPQEFTTTINQYDTLVPKHAVKKSTVNGTEYSFVYDANGNMTAGFDLSDPASVKGRTITYNADNMPTLVDHSGAGLTELVYDGDGVRARKTVSGVSTYYVGDHYEVSSNLATRHIFAGNLRVAMQTGLHPTDYAQSSSAESYYFHKDHLSSSSALTDAIAATKEITDYLPFGGERSSWKDSDAPENHYKYTDQELDAESGLYNYDARLYDPAIGSFLSADSIVPDYTDPQSLNRYSYARNNPLKYSDPTGHTFWDVSIDIGSWVWSLNDFLDEPSWTNAAALAWDTFAIAPIVPSTLGFKLFDKGLDYADDVFDAAKETTTLFRAVGEAEFKQIQRTGVFEAGPNSLGGKFFAESIEDAKKWGNALNGPGNSRIVGAEMPKGVAGTLQRWERLDGIGPARYGELDQLRNVTIKEVR